MIDALYPVGMAAAQSEYDSIEPIEDEAEETPSERIEMVEYMVSATIPVLVPKTDGFPQLEKELAEAIAKAFIQKVTDGNDFMDREDFEDKELGTAPIEPTDPFEIDCKSISYGPASKNYMAFARPEFRESWNDHFHNH